MSLATVIATNVSAALIEKVAAAVLEKYNTDAESKATLGDLMPTKSDLVDGITRLLKEGTLKFDGATKLGQFSDSLIGKVTNAVTTFQETSGGKLKVTRLFGLDTIRRVLTRPACGGIEGRKLDHPGLTVETLPNGRHVMRYFVHDLPIVDTPLASLIAFMRGLESWAKHLNIEFSHEKNDEKNANLVVTHEPIRDPPSLLALTDIGSGGPNQGGQLRMIFDKTEQSWSAAQLQATTAHELGHALGVKHADVRQSGCLMNDTLDLGILEPQTADVDAALTKGWKRR